MSNGTQAGYIYAVLAGEEYDAVSKSLTSNYLWQLGLRGMIITLLVTLLMTGATENIFSSPA